MAMESETAARAKLVLAYKEVVGLGLTELSSGNISLRYGEGMLISPTGATGETINEDNIVYVGPDDQWEAGLRPSSEWGLHARVYRCSTDTNAIVHTHSDFCVAVACHCKPLPGFHYLVGVFGGHDVPCVPYNTFGSEALAVDVAEALKTRTACLMGNHGATARGRSMEAAIKGAHRLEICCRQYIHALAMGEPRRLSSSEFEDFHRRIGTSGYAK